MGSQDYIDPRLSRALEKAVEILLSHKGEWNNEIDAYWLLVRYEDEIGVPVIYDMVKEAVEKAKAIMVAVKGKEAVKVEA